MCYYSRDLPRSAAAGLAGRTVQAIVTDGGSPGRVTRTRLAHYREQAGLGADIPGRDG
jgi:hypothetical protein